MLSSDWKCCLHLQSGLQLLLQTNTFETPRLNTYRKRSHAFFSKMVSIVGFLVGPQKGICQWFVTFLLFSAVAFGNSSLITRRLQLWNSLLKVMKRWLNCLIGDEATLCLCNSKSILFLLADKCNSFLRYIAFFS